MSSNDTETGGISDAPEAEEKPKLSLEVQVDSKSACERHVIIAVARSDVDRYLKKAFDQLQPKAEVRGFRPGRAPRKLIEAQFKDQVRDQVKGEVLMDALSQMGEEHQLAAIGEPDLDMEAITIPDDGPFKFEFDIEVRPDFEVPNWKGLKLQRPTHEFTDAEVESRLAELLKSYGTAAERKGPVQEGDAVIVDIVVTHEGELVAEHPAVHIKVVPRVLFRDTTIDGFDTLMLGATVDECKETTATISQDAVNEALRGKTVDVRLTIREIKYLKLPELTPAFLAEASDGQLESEEDLREFVRQDLERNLAYHEQQRIRAQITDILTRDTSWELPPDLLRRQAARELDRTVLELRSKGFKEDAIQTYVNNIRQNITRSTEKALREHFVFERIAEDENIEVDDNDFEREIQLIAAQANEPVRRIRARLEKRGQMDALRNQIVERKVVDLICQYAEFDEVPYTPEKESATGVDLALAGGHDTLSIPEAKHDEGPQPLPGTGTAERTNP